MAKINDTNTFPITAPAGDDMLLGTDVSDTSNDANGETVNFTINSIIAGMAGTTVNKLPSAALNMFLGDGVGPHTDLGDIAKVVVFASIEIRQSGDSDSTCSAQYRLSSDNGSSWGSWVTFETVYQYSNLQRENGMGLAVIDMGPTYNAIEFREISTNGFGSATFVALGVVGVS
jgi:hypothetical protein